MSKKWKIILSVAALLIAIRIALPFFVKDYVNKTLENLDGYSGSVEDVDLNLFRGAYVVKNVKIVQTGDSIPVPFVDIRSIDLSVHWKSLFNGSIVGEVIFNKPIVNFAVAKSSENNSKEKKVSQDGSDADWIKALDELMPLRINRFEIIDGEITYKDFTTKPEVDIFIDPLNLLATNLSNVKNKNQKLPSTLTATGKSLGGGLLQIDSRLNILKSTPDFDINFKFEQVDLPALNNFIKAYTKADVEKGVFSLYSEMAANEGNLTGYVKPVIEDLKIIEWNKEEGGFFQKLWETLVGGIAEVFQNQPKDRFATKIPIKGNLNDPNVKIWPTVLNVFKNAFIQAFTKKVDDSVEFSVADEKSKN